MAEYVTIRDVELISAGMKWKSVNGELTFTLEHMADAARAAEDPHIQPPRLKIGHDDPRFNDRADDHDPFALSGDGEAALGSVRNIRLANEGSMLVGDFVDVPVWLAEALPSAFPSRSIEGAYTYAEGRAGEAVGTWDVKTPSGGRYSFVLTACALLGVVGPAIATLDDLRRWLTAGDGLVVAGAAPEAGAVPVAATIGAVPLVPEMSAAVESIVDHFCANFAPGKDDEGYYWWPVDMYSEGGILYVDDDEGGVRAVPYETDENQNVSWGEPYKVVHRYEAAPAAAALAPSLHPGKPDVVFRTVAETPLASRHAARQSAKSGGGRSGGSIGAMDLTDEQRIRMAALTGLPEDATEQQIAAKLETPEQPTEETPEEEQSPAEVTTEEEERRQQEQQQQQSEQEQKEADAATVTVDAKVWEQTQANAALGVEAHKRQLREDRDRDLNAAVASGKIMLASKPDWERKLIGAPEATRKELEALTPGLVPVAELGHSQQEVTAEDASEEFTRAFFPELFNEEAVSNG